jgi:hypothetical protein
MLLDSHFPGDNVSDVAQGKTYTTPLRAELRRHWDNLAQLGTQEKLMYLAKRISGKLMHPVRRIRQSGKNIAFKVCVGVGLRLPLSLRSTYLVDMYAEALRQYHPQRYSGRTMYVKSALRSPAHRVAWANLIAGELEMYEVPSGHADFITVRSFLEVALEPLNMRKRI